MKKKINARFMIIAVLSIILTTILTTIVYYQVFKKEVFEDLEEFCYVLEETGTFESEDSKRMQQYAESTQNLRITVVDADGQVIYDTNTDINTLDNHRDRPEIADAFDSGKGQSIRTSSTINSSNYYYAIRLSDGRVLRVAKETSSIVNIFTQVLPVIMLIIIVLSILSFYVSHYLTRSLVKPIEQMASNLDHLEYVDTYKELEPFINLIREQHEDILNAARMRQEFTANVSHELKTPLQTIIGSAELMERGIVKEEDTPRFIKSIRQEAARLVTLIDDIIRLSQLDEGTEMPKENVSLLELAREVTETLSDAAKLKGVSLEVCGDDGVISGVRRLLYEVVYNLCDNAIKYNKQGGYVKVSVSENADNVQISVSDNGIGIAPEHQDKVFERFYRVDKSHSKQSGGTGLGLSIVKHAVQYHHGKITVDSDLDKGTNISIQFDTDIQ